ncbi:MAG: CorA family divalent cation transporter, partial [Halobacteriota archaeon]
LVDIDDWLAALQDTIIDRPDKGTLKELHEIKNRLLLLRKELWPMREEIFLQLSDAKGSALSQTELKQLHEELTYRLDTCEVERDMATSLMDVYLSGVNLKLSKNVQVLTVITAVLASMSFLAGVYGMNFDVLPELHYQFGYAGFWVVCIGMAVALLTVSRRRGWI